MTRKRWKIIAVNKIFVIFAHVGHWLKAIAVNVRGRQTVHGIPGLTGFDSGQKWYVSTRSLVCRLHNISSRKFIWRKQLRSRCLIEVQ